MTRLVLRRLMLAPVLILLASLLAFSFPQLAGVDPAQAVLRARLTDRAPDQETVRRLEREFRLDRPAVVRYGLWLGDLARGDLGNSYVDRAPVGPKLARALGVSASLVGISLTLGVVSGTVLGALAAARGGRLDALVTSAAQLGVAVPEYVVGPVLILVFAVGLGVLPSAGWEGFPNVVLPALTLAAPVAAFATQLVRAEVTDALAQPWVGAARAKGAGEVRVLWRHALPNALAAVTAVAGLWAAGLLGGSVIVEVIFSVPGLGRTLYDAVVAGDLPVIQGGLVLTVAVAVAANLASDLARILADPTLKT